MKHGRDRKAGVTLVEMLTAVAVLTVFMGGVYWALNTAQQVARLQQTRLLAGQRGWDTLSGLASGLRAVPGWGGAGYVYGRDYDGDAEDDPGAAGESAGHAFSQEGVPADAIRFSAFQPGGAVEYRLRRGESAGAPGVYRRFAEAGHGIEEAPWELINPQAVGLQFQYLGRDGLWHRRWDEPVLPRAVKMRVWMRTSPPDEALEVAEFRTVVNLPDGWEGSL